MRLVAAHYVLSLHRPARDLHRPRWIADIIDDQNVADVAFHFRRDIGVFLVDIETMHTLAVRFYEAHKFGVGSVFNLMDAKAAVRVFREAATAALKFGIDHHEVADDPSLVRVRPWGGQA